MEYTFSPTCLTISSTDAKAFRSLLSPASRHAAPMFHYNLKSDVGNSNQLSLQYDAAGCSSLFSVELLLVDTSMARRRLPLSPMQNLVLPFSFARRAISITSITCQMQWCNRISVWGMFCLNDGESCKLQFKKCHVTFNVGVGLTNVL